MNEIEVQRGGLGWSHSYLPAHRVAMIEPLKLIPSIGHQQHCGDLVGEWVGGLHSRVGKRHAEAEDESPAEFVVVTVVPADDLRSHVRGKLPGIESQTFPQRRDIAEVQLGNIDMVRNPRLAAPEQTVSRSSLGNARAGEQVEAEAKLVGFVNGPLDHQLRHVKLGLVVVEIEDAVLV